MIPLKAFTGEYPRQKPTLLPDSAAQEAVDCDFGQTVLTGIRERKLFGALSLPSNIKSFYAQEAIFTWPYEVDVVRAPVVNDAYKRFYWSDGTHYYVSRGDIGTNGQEPSSTNRYKVGVPCPAAPLVIDTAALNLKLPNTVAYDFTAIYETADGTILSEHSPGGATPLEHTPTSIVGKWTTGLTNTVGDTTTNTGVTSLIYDSFQSGFHVLKVGPGAVNSEQTAHPVQAYFHHDDYLNSPLTLTNGKFALSYTYLIASSSESGGTFETHYKTIIFYPLGYGWYSTTQGAPIPDGATAIVAQSQGTLALRLTTTLTGGAILNTILRLDGNHTLPAEYADYVFTFNAASGVLTLTIKANDNYMEYRAYTYTYVNIWGEESGYAEPATVDIAEGQDVPMTYTVLPDSSGYCPINLIRIYRTATGSSSTTYNFVAEFSPSATTPSFVDTVDSDALGAGTSTGLFEPPPQNLRGLCVMNNGIVAGFAGNELYFTEPYLPYAHVPSTVKPLPDKIVGICPTDDGLYVTTTGHPYLITGVSPDSMVDRRVPSIQSGVSKKSICSIGSSVVYASNDGLVMLRGIDASLDMSLSFFTREVWRDRYANKLSHLRLDAHDGNLLVWFDDGTPGFLVRTEGAPTLTKLTDPVYASFVYAPTDGLYVAAGSAIYEFKGGKATKPFAWHSKDFVLPKPVNFGCVQLVGAGTVTFTVYADGAQIHARTVALDEAGSMVCRLPSGFLSRRWSIALSGAANTTINECTLAFSPLELQNG